jgi:anti-anti-sigma regulatory factor
MIISSKTTDGRPHRCHLCKSDVSVLHLQDDGDTPCPNCGEVQAFGEDMITTVREIDSGGIESLLKIEEAEFPRKLLLDFSRVNTINSGTIYNLVKLQKAQEARSGKLVFCLVEPVVVEVFELMRLDAVFTICGDEAQGFSLLV